MVVLHCVIAMLLYYIAGTDDQLIGAAISLSNGKAVLAQFLTQPLDFLVLMSLKYPASCERLRLIE